MKDAASRVRIYGLDGSPMQDVACPGVGSVTFYPARQADREMFFAFTSFTSPRVMYRLDEQNALSVGEAEQAELRPVEVRDAARSSTTARTERAFR